ncbi:alpha/beta hydrolase [Gynurincola endophyticus]|uniref:alpha/beta hydrolase n=1 Tax=Gynurincola endophyticus TaxID=2479004 RepID=UPI000F8CF836|nr:dienelactone hydrolase family protein [Gynurincola endophyticus]
MHQYNIIEGGTNTTEAKAAVVFVHGRGGTAEDIMSLQQYFPFENNYLVAPQATQNTWYPYSFMAPRAQNEPWLTSAIGTLKQLVDELKLKGFTSEQIYFVAFSQGACLSLEFVATHAARYGGVFAYIGGLIGDILDIEQYNGNLLETPVYIGTSDPDAHVPVERVEETKVQFEKLNADIKVDYFKNLGHTISKEGIANGIRHVFKQ